MVDRSSLQLVASSSLVIGEHIHPDDGPVLILIEYIVDGEDVDDFLASMAELRIVRRRLGGTRWGVYQDVTAHGKFFETFLVPSWKRLPAPARSTTQKRTGRSKRGLSLSTGGPTRRRSPVSSTLTPSKPPAHGPPGGGRCSVC